MILNNPGVQKPHGYDDSYSQEIHQISANGQPHSIYSMYTGPAVYGGPITNGNPIVNGLPV